MAYSITVIKFQSAAYRLQLKAYQFVKVLVSKSKQSKTKLVTYLHTYYYIHSYSSCI